eukprot:14362889-Heterocapsa_arctica.AAC.1
MIPGERSSTICWRSAGPFGFLSWSWNVFLGYSSKTQFGEAPPLMDLGIWDTTATSGRNRLR